MDKQLKLGLDIIAALEKTQGRYIDISTNGVNSCGAISIMATSFKENRPEESSILFAPIPKYLFDKDSKNKHIEVEYDIKPFIGIGEVTENGKKKQFPIVNTNFLTFKQNILSYRDLLINFNKSKKMPFRFIGFFEIIENTDTGVLDLETREFTTDDYVLYNFVKK